MDLSRGPSVRHSPVKAPRDLRASKSASAETRTARTSSRRTRNLGLVGPLEAVIMRTVVPTSRMDRILDCRLALAKQVPWKEDRLVASIPTGDGATDGWVWVPGPIGDIDGVPTEPLGVAGTIAIKTGPLD